MQEDFGKIKRKRNTYRLSIVNEDTFEDVTSFKFSRISAYIFLSSSFVFIVSFTIIIISFTPLKYYIPGYYSQESRTTFELMQIKTDSLEKIIYQNDQYLANLKKVLNDDKLINLDTTTLNLNNSEISVE